MKPTPSQLLTAWKDAAKTATPSSPPDLSILIEACGDSPFLRQAHIVTGRDGLPRVAVWPEPPKPRKRKVGQRPEPKPLTEPRKFPPVFAATARTLELAGWSCYLHSVGRIYQTSLSHPAPREVLTQLGKILNNVPRAVSIRELDGGDFHDFDPSNSRLTIGPDQSDVQAIVALEHPELASLLDDLFGICRAWHGDKLTVKRIRTT